jgi:uncharacterized membrane protein YedE/YeeE
MKTKLKGALWGTFSQPGKHRLMIDCLAVLFFLLFFTPAVGSTFAAAAAADETSGLSIWEMVRWSPYGAGIGIGVLSWLAFLLSDNTLGASGAYAKLAGLLEARLRGRPKVVERTYYREDPPEIGWGEMLLAGIVIGAFLAALLSGDFRLTMVPDLWTQQVGPNGSIRWWTALAGGILLGIGSRWAGGCTSGHGISGTLQLVVSSWVAVLSFFVGGVTTAFFLYG